MAERPIIFSAEMVRAILAGRKTQTRRIVKPDVAEAIQFLGGGVDDAPATADSFYIEWITPEDDDGKPQPEQWCLYSMEYPEEGCCPLGKAYGRPGDLLWVREACRAEKLESGSDGVRYLADGALDQIENSQDAAEQWLALHRYRDKEGATVPPIHMPRWASRITLAVGKTRIERLQDISSTDALAEGIEACSAAETGCKGAYRDLWDSINGAGSWDANPWVWVVEFQRVTPRR
jgi:hypothetical protein